MTITDAITLSQNEAAVYALLAAYIESLWHSGVPYGLPESLQRLPITDETDVLERAKALDLERIAYGAPVVAEAAEIFRAASERLLTAAQSPRGALGSPSEELPAQ